MPSVQESESESEPQPSKRVTRPKLHLSLNDCPSERFALWADKSFQGPRVSKPGCVRVEFFPPPPPSPPPPPLPHNISARTSRTTPNSHSHGDTLVHVWSLPRAREPKQVIDSTSSGTNKTAQRRRRKRGMPRERAPTKLERAEESFRAKQEPMDETCPPTPPPLMAVRWATPELAPPPCSVPPDLSTIDDLPSLDIHCASPTSTPPSTPPESPPQRPWSSPFDSTQLLHVPAPSKHCLMESNVSRHHRMRSDLSNDLLYAPHSDSDSNCGGHDSLLAAISRRELPPLGLRPKQGPRTILGSDTVRIADLHVGGDASYAQHMRRAGHARFAPYHRPAAVVLPPLSQLIADCKRMHDEDLLKFYTKALRYDGRQRMPAVAHRQTSQSPCYSDAYHSD
ncbi:hypothetical protein C8Q80DRAFT_126981 [Daedaleopsis nitida]|nr:hypothetical protein C8Q80DRAFT_126981 [Daedaleopsis nitida]